MAPEGDKQTVLALPAKDLKISDKQHMISDLSPKQMAYAIAEAYDFMHTTDILGIGGETAAWQHLVL